MKHEIRYTTRAQEHLQSLPQHQQVLVLDTVDRQLMYEPTVQTRNRKPMRANPLAPWELRIGDLRVYFDVMTEAHLVKIEAVGVKVGNKVHVSGEELEL